MKTFIGAQEKARGLAYIAQIEQTFQLLFEEGRNPDVQFMAHLWEPLRWLHKPLAVYMLAEGMGLVTSCLLHVLGFRVFRHHNVSTPTISSFCCSCRAQRGFIYAINSNSW